MLVFFSYSQHSFRFTYMFPFSGALNPFLNSVCLFGIIFLFPEEFPLIVLKRLVYGNELPFFFGLEMSLFHLDFQRINLFSSQPLLWPSANTSCPHTSSGPPGPWERVPCLSDACGPVTTWATQRTFSSSRSL